MQLDTQLMWLGARTDCRAQRFVLHAKLAKLQVHNEAKKKIYAMQVCLTQGISCRSEHSTIM